MLNIRQSCVLITSLIAITVGVSGCGSVVDLSRTVARKMPFYDANEDADIYASRAVNSLLKGEIKAAETYSEASLGYNPEQPDALLVSAMIHERLGNLELARYRYQKLSEVGGVNEVTMLHLINSLKAKPLEEVSSEGLDRVNTPTIKEILAQEVPVYNFDERGALPEGAALNTYGSEGIVPANGDARLAFGERDFNVIKRFVVFKHLVDEGLVTPSEFKIRRDANIGALLPYTAKTLPAKGLEEKVPKVKAIITRMQALSEAFKMKIITPKEHAAERMVILNSLLPEPPFEQAHHIALPTGMFESAAAVRRLATLEKMKLIDSKEKIKEELVLQDAIKINTHQVPASLGNMPRKRPLFLDTSAPVTKNKLIEQPSPPAAPRPLIMAPSSLNEAGGTPSVPRIMKVKSESENEAANNAQPSSSGVQSVPQQEETTEE